MLNTNFDYEEEVLVIKAYKDHSGKKQEGKFIKRPKSQKPVNHLQVVKASRCHKKAYSNIEQAKEALKAFRYAQKKAQDGQASTSHREVRYYQCENCGFGSKTAIWHLTSLSVENYTDKLVTRGGYELAA